MTSKIDKIYPFQVASNLKDREGVILVDQIRTIDCERFSNKIGELSLKKIDEIEKALHLTLALKT